MPKQVVSILFILVFLGCKNSKPSFIDIEVPDTISAVKVQHSVQSDTITTGIRLKTIHEMEEQEKEFEKFNIKQVNVDSLLYQ